MRNPNQWATGTDANPDPQFFVQLAAQRLLCCLTGLALATRELPRAGQITVIAAPRPQNAALTTLHHCRAALDRFRAHRSHRAGLCGSSPDARLVGNECFLKCSCR